MDKSLATANASFNRTTPGALKTAFYTTRQKIIMTANPRAKQKLVAEIISFFSKITILPVIIILPIFGPKLKKYINMKKTE